jgi:transcriptional regulator with XRE-family HTH domain
MNKLARYVKNKRLDAGLSQRQYARIIGVTSMTLSNIENGRHVGTSTIRKLSEHFILQTKTLRGMMINEDNQQA